MRVLISGARGFVGAALTAALRREGHNVVRLARTDSGTEAEDWRWDPESGRLGRGDWASVEGVVHLAGENIAAGRWTNARKRRIRDSRVRDTEALRRALQEAARDLRVWVAASATGYYGDRGDEVLTEESGMGRGFLPEVCSAWESAAQPLATAGTRVAWLRIGLVLDRDGGALRRMIPLFRWGLGGALGHGRQWWSWVHRQDLVRIMSRALTDDEWSGPVNAVAPGAVTNREFTRVLAKVLRRPAWVPVPAWALRLALGAMADELLLASTRVQPRRLEEGGFEFLHPNLQAALEC